MPPRSFFDRRHNPAASFVDDTPLRQVMAQEAEAAGQVNGLADSQDIIKQEVAKQNRANQEIAAAQREAAKISKANLAEAKRRGIETAVDPTSGEESIRRHEDGTPMWQAGFQGAPKAGDDGKHSVTYRDPRGTSYTLPLDSINRTEDPTGAFYEFDLPQPDGQVQRIRRPEDAAKPLFKVDKETGRRYAEAQDLTTGGMIQQPLGIDTPAANAAAIERKKAEYEQARDARRFQEEKTRATIDYVEQTFKPIKDRFNELQRKAKEFTTGTTYEQRQDGVYSVKDDIGIPIKDNPEQLLKGQNWLAEKKRVDDELAKVQAEHDPLEQQIQQMKVERAKLAIQVLDDERREQNELLRIQQAAKQGRPVWNNESQRRVIEAQTKDAAVNRIMVEGRLDEESSPLLSDVQQVGRNPIFDALMFAMSGGRTQAPDLSGAPAAPSQSARLDQLLKSLPKTPGTPPADPAALGITNPENYEIATDPQSQNPNLVDRRSKLNVGYVDVANGRLNLWANVINGDDDDQRILKNATVPAFIVGGGALPMRPAERKNYFAGILAAVDAGDEQALITAGGDIPTIRQNFRMGRISIQDANKLMEIAQGVKPSDMTTEGVEAGLESYIKASPLLSKRWKDGKAEREVKEEIVNQYLDGVAQREETSPTYSRIRLQELRLSLLKKHAPKGEVEKWIDRAKMAAGSSAGVVYGLGQLSLELQTKAISLGNYELSEQAQLNLANTPEWWHNMTKFMSRMDGDMALRRDLDALKEWSMSAMPGDTVPEELADRLANTTFNAYHKFTDQEAAERATSPDSFNVLKNSALADRLQQFLATGNYNDWSALDGLIKMDERSRELAERNERFVTAPRAANAEDVIERASVIGKQLTPGTAQELLNLVKTPPKDDAMRERMMKVAKGILGYERDEDVLMALDLVTRDDAYAQNSVAGYFRGGRSAGLQEGGLELASILAGFGWGKVAVRGAIGATTEATVAATRTARLGRMAARGTASIVDDLSQLGLFQARFGKPLSFAQKASNAGVSFGKAIAGDMLSEGIEEGIAALGEPGSTPQTVAEAAKEGALSAPIMVGGMAALNLPFEIRKQRSITRDWQTKKADYLAKVNERLAAIPGTNPFTAEEFEQALMLYGNTPAQQAEAAVAESYAAYVAELQASPKLPDGSPMLTPAAVEAQTVMAEAVGAAQAREALAINAALELRELNEEQRVLFTAVAKAQMGLNQFTVPEAQALTRLSGRNRVRFVPAPTPQLPQQANSMPSVALLPGRRVMLVPGSVPVLPAAILTEAAQAAPSLGELINAPVIQPAATNTPLSPDPATGTAQNAPEQSAPVQPQDRGASAQAAATTAPGVVDIAQGTAEASLANAVPVQSPIVPQQAATPAVMQPQAVPPVVAPLVTPAAKATPQQAKQVQNITRSVIDTVRKNAPGLRNRIQERKKAPDYATGGMWMESDGTIAYHVPTLVEQLGPLNLPAQTLAKRIAGLLDEEVRHAANIEASRRLWQKEGNPWDYETWRDAWYGDIWENHFTEEMRQKVMEAYGDTLPEAPWIRAMEGLRMLDQLRATDSITESILRHLEAVVQYLREIFDSLTPTVKQELEAMQAVLQEFGYEAGQVQAEKAKKEPKKPRKKAKASGTPKSSTQLTLAPQDAADILAFGESIPKNELYESVDPEWSDGALEKQPHVTVLYGLTKHEAGPVAETIKNHGPVNITLGKTSLFESPEYDVLKIDVEGPSLRALNSKLAKLPHENSFPDYKPHLTIAYLKKGEGAKYAGDARFEGRQITFDSMTFSAPKDIRAKIGLPELPLNSEIATNAEWQPFPADMGSLDIPRASMPQIRGEHRGALVQFLKGAGISHAQEEVAPNTLRPSQAEYSPSKVARAKTFEGKPRSILVSSDNHVVDGHHQWMAAFEQSPTSPIPVIRLDAPIQQLLIEVARFPSSSVDRTSAEGEAATPPESSPSTSGASEAAKEQARKAFEGLASAPAPDGSVDNGGTSEQTARNESARTNLDRSGNSRDLLEAAARLGGANAPIYFGPESAGKLAEVREKELTALTQEVEAPPPPSSSPTFEGGEHSVYILPEEGQVLKYTLEGYYGRFMNEVKLFDSRTFLNLSKLTLRGAMPSEYLRRWAVLSDIFGFDATYLGQRPDKTPKMVVAQPYIEQTFDESTQRDDEPEIDDVIAFMEAKGFTKVDSDLIAIPEIADVTWYRQRDGILITDAHPRNFRKEASTKGLIPIDLIITTVPKGVSKILPEPDVEWTPGQQEEAQREGLASAPAPSVEQIPIPPERRAAFRALADTLLSEKITSAESLSAFLDEVRPDGTLQKFRDSLMEILRDTEAGPAPAEVSAPADGTVVSYEGRVGRIQKTGERWEIETPTEIIELTSEQVGDVQTDVSPEARGQMILGEINAARERFIKQIEETNINLWPATFRATGDGTLTITDDASRVYKPHNPRLSRSMRVENGVPNLLLQRMDEPGRIIRLTGQHALAATDALLDAAASVEEAGGKVQRASAPAPQPSPLQQYDQQKLKDALEKMPQIWRTVLHASMQGTPVEKIAADNNLSLQAVGNILRAATGRLGVLLAASRTGKLKPTVQVEDNKVKAAAGDAGKAMGANPAFVAVDQRRSRPEEVTHAEMQEQAQRLFETDAAAAEQMVTRWMDSGTTVLSLDGMPEGIRSIVNDAQARQAAEMLMTAAAKLLVTQKSLAGGDAFEIARLIDLYRTTGTEQARALNMRFDPHQKPEERAAMFISEALLTPPASMRDEIRRNPANKERILKEWSAKAQQIKEQLKAAGYDIDATFAAFQREQQAAEATVPSEIKVPLARVAAPVRALVRGVLEGKSWREAAAAGKMSLDDAKNAYNAFRKSINETAAKAAQAARDAMLLSAPATDYASQIGLPEWTDDVIADETPVQTAATEALKKERSQMRKQGEVDLSNPVAVARLTNDLMPFKSAAFDKLSEFWRASILSGPQTHVVNIFSGLAFGAYEATVKKMGAGVLGDIGRMFGIQTDAASLSDIPAMLSATIPAVQKAFADAIRAWKAESSFFNAYALDETRAGPMVKGEAFEPALKGPVGKIMRGISFRLMLLADEFVKSFFTRIEVAAQARQIARSEGLSGEKMAKRIQEMLLPGSEAWVRGLDQALKITFQTELGANNGVIDQIDGLAKAIQRGKNGDFGALLKGISHFVFPFVSTPTNIFKMGVTMSPLGTFLALIDAARSLNQRRKGNVEEAERLYNAARLFDDMVNQIVAWGGVLAVSSLVQPGEDDDGLPRLTGSLPWKDTREGERELAYRTAPPTSIRIFNHWLNYGRLDPFASALAFMVDTVKEFQSGAPLDKTWAKVGIQMLTTMQDKTFLQGLSDVMNAARDPERFGTRWATNIATGFIPNLIRQPIRSADENIRENDLPNDMSFWDVLGHRIGYSVVPQMAPAAIDVWGRPQVKGTGTGSPQTDFLMRLFSPIQPRDASKVDPLDVAILRYNMKADKPLALTAPDRELSKTIGGVTRKVSLPDEEWEAFAVKTGNAARQALGSRYNHNLTPEEAEEIYDIVGKVRSVYRDSEKRRAFAQ